MPADFFGAVVEDGASVLEVVNTLESMSVVVGLASRRECHSR